MRLIRIRLAGFKSFVDPTTFVLPGQLVGIVGPNGCGKSNIIDAVRWVLGESSARSLRGESMADVIFNGSSVRKPVGQATIELIFDNSTGRLSGPWAQYNEIAVKRVVSRSGQSQYFLNGTRCRRRDITGLFLGTGLGPRSYAIIEQGMIARVVESKPEELRIFLEEAAGISRYKERRRETENRIRHTRENLDQLTTLRDELARQLETLKRQARNAERFREYRAEERRLKAELLALRWRDQDRERVQREQQIRDQELALEALIAEQRHLENRLEGLRQRRQQDTEQVSRHQEVVYRLGTEITRLEQARVHRQELRDRYLAEKSRHEQNLSQLDQQLGSDRETLAQLEQQLQELAPALEALQARTEEAEAHQCSLEAGYRAAQQDWESTVRIHGEHQRQAEVSRTRIEYLEHRQLEQQRRLDQVQLALKTLQDQDDDRLETLEETVTTATDALRQQQQTLERVEAQLAQMDHQQRELATTMDSDQQAQQSARGRLSSLETLQHAALKRDQGRQQWLEEQQLDHLPRLAETLSVDNDWEIALETVLEGHLDMLWVEGELESVAERLDDRAPGGLGLLSPAPAAEIPADSLQARVSRPSLPDHLCPVRTVADLSAGLRERARLGPGESLITPEGVWLGRHWLKFRAPDDDPHTGMLSREREIRDIQASLATLAADLEASQAQLDALRHNRTQLDAERRALATALQEAHAREARLEAELEAARRRHRERQERRIALETENDELLAALTESQETIIETRQTLEEVLLDLEDAALRRDHADEHRRQHQERLDQARQQADERRAESQRRVLEQQALVNHRELSSTALERLTASREQSRLRLMELTPPEENDDGEAKRLSECLAQRLQAEEALTGARQSLGETETELAGLEKARGEREQAVQEARGHLEARRLAWGETRVRAQGLLDQLAELEADLDVNLAALPAQASEADWQARLSQVAERIQRLGAVNLAAIDEFRQQSERKDYLDSQYQDLSEALATLEGAIRQIDRETRERLKDTFERVNRDLQALFPRLFGGGEAHLSLTGDDLLDAGVAVMARPPGKRIGTIHLLSGGEKTLTAIALVFAIFQLNPAPFCMLDEVDAPLDEANVERFGALLQEMAESIQFIVITHNKSTMGVLEHLSGVTMSEPGVSRVVAVDVDEALRLAAV